MTPTKCKKCGTDDTQSFTTSKLAGTEKPKRPPGAGESAVIMLALFIVFDVIAGLTIGILYQFGFDPLYAGIIGVVLGLLVVLIGGFFAANKIREAKAKREAAYNAAMMKWQSSWICLRCGNTFHVR